MVEKEADSPLIISNFELNKSKNKVVIYINKRIFPVSSVKEAAFLFKDTSWVALEENENEILVELKPKSIMDLELLAREFNNELLAQSTKEIKKVDAKPEDFISKIREVVSEFLSEEQGRISKQSILTIGTILATLGLAEAVSASHLCEPPPGEGGGGDGESCFSKNELVLTPAGIQEINKIMAGSQVVSYDEKTNMFTTSIVGQVIAHDGKRNNFANFIKYPLVNLSINVNDKIHETKVTENHPYFDVVERRYKQLKDLKVGDMVKTIDGEGTIVGKEILIDEKSPAIMHNEVVYNLHMSKGPHNYIVNGAVVHNKDCCFLSGQMVLTPQGPMEINKLTVDSKIISYDERTNTFTTSTVGQVISHDGKNSWINNFAKHPLLRLSYKIKDKFYETKVTDNHPYFDVAEGRYKQLRDFKVGDRIKTIDGDGIIVSKEVLIDADSPAEMHNEVVYNLHMSEGPHNYVVNGAVVHNKAGGGCCFVSNQLVLTPAGQIEINNINANDKIISYDEKADAFITSTVGEVIVHDGKLNNFANFIRYPLVNLSINVNGKLYETKVTDNHPYLDAVEGGYKQLGEFKIGDKIKTIDGDGIIVSKEVLIDVNSPAEMHNEVVYNLHMKEGPHNYVVNGAVVHNKEGDGGDAACFPVGTKILLANGALKDIEGLKIDDVILVYDINSNDIAQAKVLELDSKIRKGYYKFNNNLLKITDDHPVYTRKKSGIIGWASINPEKSLKTYKIGCINKLEIGDKIFTIDKSWVELTSMEYVEGPIMTYTLKDIEGYDSFFADGVLVLKSNAKVFLEEVSVEVQNRKLKF